MNKLHLGCWKRFIPGFVHVDLCDMPHIDYNHSVDSLPMFEDGSAELIYASHVLEYFDRQEAKRVLDEWYRVLCVGGVLRIAVPDFPKLVEVYEKTKCLDRVAGPLYGRMEIDTLKGKRILYHKTVYDFTSLSWLLESCGFHEVSRYDWRATIHKDYDDHSQAYFPYMDKENGILVSLNVQGVKK